MSDASLRKKVPITLQVAIMAVPMLQMGISVMTPVIATIGEAFPDVPLASITLVQTMPNLFIMPFALIAGMAAGRGKLTYRKLVFAAIILWTAGGLLPFFVYDSFAVLLVCRAVFGIGSGIIFPMGQMLVYNFVRDKSARPRVLANNTLAMNLGGCFFQYAAGFLALINWNYVFLCYLLGIISFILVLLWLKNPETEFPSASEAAAESEEEEVKQLSIGESFRRIPPFMYLLLVFYGLSVILNTPVTTLVSSFVLDGGGTPVEASTILVMYTIAGLVMGFIFPHVFKLFKRFSIAVGILIEAIAYFIMYFIGTPVACGVGLFLSGAGLIIFMPALQQEIGLFCPKGADTVASGIMMFLMNVGMFVGGYWGALAADIVGSDNLYIAWVVSGACLLVLMVIVVLVHIKDRPEFHLGEKKE